MSFCRLMKSFSSGGITRRTACGTSTVAQGLDVVQAQGPRGRALARVDRGEPRAVDLGDVGGVGQGQRDDAAARWSTSSRRSALRSEADRRRSGRSPRWPGWPGTRRSRRSRSSATACPRVPGASGRSPRAVRGPGPTPRRRTPPTCSSRTRGDLVERLLDRVDGEEGARDAAGVGEEEDQQPRDDEAGGGVPHGDERFLTRTGGDPAGRHQLTLGQQRPTLARSHERAGARHPGVQTEDHQDDADRGRQPSRRCCSPSA